jgi:hypothetical protein
MNEIGHNKPDMTTTAAEVTQDLGHWLAENPVIQSEEQAKEAKVYLDRSVLCIQDMEAERDGLVRPLNERIKQVNNRFRGPRELLEKVINVLRKRLDQYIQAEEIRRNEIARRAREAAEQAEIAARNAESAEHDAMERVSFGELGVDVVGAAASADGAFADHQKAERQAAIAEKETHVKIGGGFRRALGLREREVLTVPDPFKAIDHLWPNADIEAAIVKAARAYKKKHGKYPEGIWVIRKREI